MKITAIKLKTVSDKPNVLGIADIELDSCLVIHNVQLIKSYKTDKRMLSFPHARSVKVIADLGNTHSICSYSDIVHPINQEFRDYVESEVFKFYDSLRKE